MPEPVVEEEPTLVLQAVAVPASEMYAAAGQVVEGTNDAAAEAALADLDALSASLEGGEPENLLITPLPVDEEEVDFSALLESLDIAADDQAAGEEARAPTVEEPIAAGFDEALLREKPPVVGGVISTDAFLEDIDSGMALSGGLTDELSALTGADRPSRPSASVKKLPEPGSDAMLHRDSRVDKDTLLKIIDGIKNL